MDDKPAIRDAEDARKYRPPVSIPLDFERAVEGLLAVKPAADEKGAEAGEKRPKRKK